MKNNYLLMFLMGITLFISCSVDNDPIEEFPNLIIIGGDIGDINDGNVINEANLDPDLTVDLIAGQNMDAGSVTASEIDGNLDVTYQTEGDWIIVETHLYVGSQEGMPANNPGNPRIGQFPYATEHDPGTTSFTYSDLGEIPIGECVWVAAHAVVYNTVTGDEETAWANGEDIPGNSWAMYFEVCNN